VSGTWETGQSRFCRIAVIAIVKRDAHAALRQLHRDDEADPARGAGDEREED